MKAALALALACLLFANGVLGAGGLLNRYQPPRQGRRLSAMARHASVDAYKPSGRKMLALIPSLGSTSGSSGSSSGSGSNKTSTGTSGSSGSKNATAEDLVLTTTVAYGDNVVACKEWVPENLSWEWPSKPTEFTAAAKTQPPAADVQKLTALICSDAEAAGEQIQKAVQAGGSDAQIAVFALFSADCPSNEEAASDAYGAAIDAVNDGDATKIDQVSSWLENFAKAADEVGVPVCMSLAVIDMTTDEAVETRDFHATGPAPKSSRGSGSSSSGGSSSGTKGSSTGTVGKSSSTTGKGSSGGR